MRIEIDGAVFDVEHRTDNSFTYTWVNGPGDGGSGFATSASGGSIDLEAHRENIQSYLAIADPDTGYIPDDD